MMLDVVMSIATITAPTLDQVHSVKQVAAGQAPCRQLSGSMLNKVLPLIRRFLSMRVMSKIPPLHIYLS